MLRTCGPLAAYLGSIRAVKDENHSRGDAEPDEPCYGVNPVSGLPCILAWHEGFHVDGQGNEWLDD